MRATNGLLLFTIAMAASVAGAGGIGLAQAQQNSVQAIFKKYDLLGTFAYDCTRPPSKQSAYYVNRLIDPNHVQRDQMEGPDARAFFVMINQAKETAPNEVWYSGRLTGTFAGKPLDAATVEASWRLNGTRILQWDAVVAGYTILAASRHMGTGREMPPLYRCGTK